MTSTAVELGRRTPPTPAFDQHKALEQYSPRTITLRNQTDAILRGMTSTHHHAHLTPHGHDEHTAMMLTAQREQLFRQTAQSSQKPFLPTNLPTAPPCSTSRPIRITRRKQLQPRYNHAPKDPDAHLSASPTELQHYYDEASWRMYNLIQSARSEKQRAKAQVAAVGGQVADGSFFRALPDRTPVSLLPSGTGMPMALEEDPMMAAPQLVENNDEGVFELDDL